MSKSRHVDARSTQARRLAVGRPACADAVVDGFDPLAAGYKRCEGDTMKRRRISSLVAVATALGIADSLRCWQFLAYATTTSRPSGDSSPAGADPGATSAATPRTRDDDMALDGVFLAAGSAGQAAAGDGRRADPRADAMAKRCVCWARCWRDAEDFFFKPDADQPVYRSLKAEAGRLLADLPGEGRAVVRIAVRRPGPADAQQTRRRPATWRRSPRSRASSSSPTPAPRRRFCWAATTWTRTGRWPRRCASSGCCELPKPPARLEPALSLSLATCWLRAGKPEKGRSRRWCN